MRVPDGYVPVPTVDVGFCTGCEFGTNWREEKCGWSEIAMRPAACYEGTRHACIFVHATPENIARSVAWRLTK